MIRGVVRPSVWNSSSSTVCKIRTLTVALLIVKSRCFSVSTTPKANIMTPSSPATVLGVNVPTENWEAIANLRPENVWRQFAILSSIPRPSKKEDAVLNYIKSFAKERDLQWKQDPVGNLVVFKDGKKGCQPVIIQGHVDMVTEKNRDTAHDFEKDPIRLQKKVYGDKENWLCATGTTLGADNGIGVATALALLDEDNSDGELPPLEALFTVDEETGLTGATDLDAKALGLTGTTMLNLDTEEWGELYVGCAGGGESMIRYQLKRDNTSTAKDGNPPKLIQLRVQGLMGGHSGINIHEGRANAVLLCAAATHAALKACGDNNLRLISIEGGDKHNAIPREAFSVLSYDGDDTQVRTTMEGIVERCRKAAQAEYGMLETNLQMDITDHNNDGKGVGCPVPIENENASRLLSMLMALPHGPMKFSHAMPDLVETSNNVASIRISSETDQAEILCSTRSSVSQALESMRDRIAAIVALTGPDVATMERLEAYPGWNPNLQSPILQLGKRLLREKYLPNQQEPGVKAIHAGLECGLLIEKLGGNIDVLSFGPTIHGAHSPDERVNIDTVPPFYDLVKDILKELASA